MVDHPHHYRVDMLIPTEGQGNLLAWRVINLDDIDEKHIIEEDITITVMGAGHPRFHLIPEEKRGQFEFFGFINCVKRTIILIDDWQ